MARWYALFALFAILTPLCAEAPAHAASFDVPLEHPVYGLLDQVLTPAVVGPLEFTARPYTEEHVVFLLHEALEKGDAGLRPAVEEYLREFEHDSTVKSRLLRFGFNRNSDSVWFYPYVEVRGAYQDSHFTSLGFNSQGLDSLSTGMEWSGRVKTGAAAYAKVGGLLLYFKGSIITEYNSLFAMPKTNDPHLGYNLSNIFEKENIPGHLLGCDEFVSYAKLSLPYMDLKIGRDKVVWSRSQENGLLFSGNGTPFFNIQMEKGISNLYYHFVWGKLLADNYSQKRYLYAKNIRWQALPWLSVGFSDEVISINRDLEPIYFLPLVPFFFSQHYVGDPDNVLMGFDMSMSFSRALVYGELFMDDMRNMVGYFDTKDPSNKWAGLLGCKVKTPWPKYLPQVTFEFAQVEPWVYTTSAKDNRDENDSLIYNYPVHFGSVLGTPLGPNARNVAIGLSGPYGKKWRSGLSLAQVWKGRDTGSFVYDVNPSIIDPVDSTSHLMYTSKEDMRFSPLGRQRTLLSGHVEFQPLPWNVYNLSATWLHERRPRVVNEYQIMVNAQFNF